MFYIHNSVWHTAFFLSDDDVTSVSAYDVFGTVVEGYALKPRAREELHRVLEGAGEDSDPDLTDIENESKSESILPVPVQNSKASELQLPHVSPVI
eukprot:1393123-Amorphochlora_amoeboformis.AAC.1